MDARTYIYLTDVCNATLVRIVAGIGLLELHIADVNDGRYDRVHRAQLFRREAQLFQPFGDGSEFVRIRLGNQQSHFFLLNAPRKLFDPESCQLTIFSDSDRCGHFKKRCCRLVLCK